ncbi:hypothetical protein [Amycolatopsis tolypomycina]|uniref:hypothetical protein n=1 Tax=Amycolatopsis tolypomycina TaxID=208445 RepID=UPI0033A855B3
MPLSTCTITGQWRSPVDLPVATGKVRIQPVAPAAGGGYIIAGEPVWVDLVGGAISETVVSNAEAASLQYLITEHIAGADNPPPYVISPAGATVDLSTAPRSASGTTSLYVLASAAGQPGGYATLGQDGRVPAGQLPPASGGDAVESVNGRTGAVTLTKTDVGLPLVDNTSDAAKPVSTAQAAAIAAKENTGVAAGLMSAHTGAADPHPQYLLPAEGDARYDALGAATAAVATAPRYVAYTGSSWPARGAGSRMVIFVGGPSSSPPSDGQAGDLWQPAS